MLLRIEHSDVTWSSRSAGEEVFIEALRTGTSEFGAWTEVLLAVMVILSAGMLEAAKAACWRTMTTAAARRRATRTVRIGDRRARRTMAMSRLLRVARADGGVAVRAGTPRRRPLTSLSSWTCRAYLGAPS